MGTPEDPHGAAPSALGYLYQCRYALLEGLCAVRNTPQLFISIEKFDDVAFEANGEPTDLIQTKHHIDKTGDLFDSSVDLWKTIAVWLSKLAEDIDTPISDAVRTADHRECPEQIRRLTAAHARPG